jgi:predicted dehydrogenase
MKTVNAAVIGSGFIGPAHVEALKRIPGVRVLAIASDDAARVREVAEYYDIPRTYLSWQEAIADRDIEVVHNCTPNNLHFEINRAALLADKHVLSEKPLTLTSREAGELLALAEQRGRVHGVNFNYRFYPLVQQARQMVRAGEVGSVHLVHGHYLQDWLLLPTDYNWRIEPAVSGASRAVADIGSHWFDLVQFITGLRIVAVNANLLTVHGTRSKPAGPTATFVRGTRAKSRRVRINTEDAGTILLEFDNGAIGSVTVSQVSPGRKNREWFEIDGSRRALAWNQEEPNTLWIGCREKANELLIKDPSLLRDEVKRYAHYPGGHPEGYPDGPKNLFHNFYQYIRARKRPTMPDHPTFADGLQEIRIVEAVLESHRKRRWTEVLHSQRGARR